MALSGNPIVLGSGLPIPAGGVSLVGGPALSTDNAIVRWDGTTGNLIQNSVLIVNDTTGALSGFTTGAGLTFHGGGTLTGASGVITLNAAGALVTFGGNVSASGDLSASGITLPGGGTLTGASGALTLTPTAGLAFTVAAGTNGTSVFSGTGAHVFSGPITANYANAVVTAQGSGNPAIAASSTTGSITTKLQSIGGDRGLVGTETNHPLDLYTNNTRRGGFAAAGAFDVVGNLTVSGTGESVLAGSLAVPKTITAAATVGAQTINKMSGSVNFAAAATSLVVTNSLVTVNSVIIATVGTNDTTMKSTAAVAAAGSFTLFANAAATAETRVNFLVTN